MTEQIPDEAEEYARKGAVIALVLIGLYVGLRFYWSVVGFIQVWAPHEFADLLEAFFNLTVLLLIVAALGRLARGKASDGEGESGAEDDEDAVT